MGLVSPSQSSPGDTIEAADINTPVNQLAAVINGNIETANLADSSVTTAKLADAAVTPAKLVAGTGSSWAWQSYTPTWTASSSNPAIGNGTLAGYYSQTGKTVNVKILVTAGGTTTFGSGSYMFALPVTASSNAMSQGLSPLGRANIFDTSASNTYTTNVVYYDTSTVRLKQFHTGTISNQVDNNFYLGHNDPVTWASGDIFALTFTYEAA